MTEPANHFADALEAQRRARKATREAYDALNEAYKDERDRYYAYLADDDARDWVVLMEPLFTIDGYWLDGVSSDDLSAITRKVEKINKLCNAVDALLARRRAEAEQG